MIFMPQDDSVIKHEPGVYLGTPGSNPPIPVKESRSAVRKVRTMKEDVDEAKKERERLSAFEPSKKTVAKKPLLASVWSKISGKEKAEKEVAELATEKEQLRIKADAEDERVRLEAEAETAAINAKVEKERVEKEALEKAGQEKIRVEEEQKAREVVLEKERVEAETNLLKQKEDSLAFAKLSASPEGGSVRDRAVATASIKAAEIIAKHGKALSKTIDEATEIVEEKERVRVEITRIIEEEEKALSEVTKLIEKDERERAEAAKIEASQKRARAEASSDRADAMLIKERNEANEAEIIATKERAEAEAAEILAKKERVRAREAAEIEAKEIFEADKQVQIAVDAANREIEALKKRTRAEAEAIALAQKTARAAEVAEVAEISTIEKTAHQQSK
ncbi:MAG: hypothetical protein WBC83_00025 [Minisyncoccia bacterium]